jgi:hypothetical protein
MKNIDAIYIWQYCLQVVSKEKYLYNFLNYLNFPWIFFKISKILAGKFPASRIPFPEASGDQT